MPPSTAVIPGGDAYPFLRAATTAVRHHTRAQPDPDTTTAPPADRLHLDTLHAHLTALHLLVDRLAEATRPERPAATRNLATAHARLWQAADAVHEAFHLLPAPESGAGECRPERLPEGPPVLTICQRHLAASHAVRRKTTTATLAVPAP
ncbi:DUF6238 family protein [Streptomyces sp. NPDC059070]|uniref:DUF6238 family protein n=1 Tax=Streptomyces sp. NPDC059070 TaxID=3346713 RepID=UPI0036993F67